MKQMKPSLVAEIIFCLWLRLKKKKEISSCPFPGRCTD